MSENIEEETIWQLILIIGKNITVLEVLTTPPLEYFNSPSGNRKGNTYIADQIIH